MCGATGRTIETHASAVSAAGVSPQTRARVAWIFFSMRAINSRLAATKACSASISATIARWVVMGGRGIGSFLNDSNVRCLMVVPESQLANEPDIDIS